LDPVDLALDLSHTFVRQGQRLDNWFQALYNEVGLRANSLDLDVLDAVIWDQVHFAALS
jgi:hypothetical protein